MPDRLRQPRQPSLADALVPLATLALLIGGSLALFGLDALVPWNSCGAFMGATLGVSTLLYAPYAVFCYASPLLSVLYGYTGFRIERIEPSDTAKELT